MIENPQVGMRVRFTGPGPAGSLENEPAVICHLPSPGSIGIAFDRYVGGHDCRGGCESGYGWYTPPDDLTLEAPWEPRVGMRVRVDGVIPDIRYTATGTGVVEEFSPVTDATQPYNIRFDQDAVVVTDTGDRVYLSEEEDYRLWCPRDILFPVEREGVVDGVVDDGRVTLFGELEACPPLRGTDIPDHLLSCSLWMLAQYILCEDSEVATPSEYERLTTLVGEIRDRLKASSTTELVMNQLLGRDRF